MKEMQKTARKQQDVAWQRTKNHHDATDSPSFAAKKVADRKLGSLRPHPKQGLFSDLPTDEIRRLADSMKRDGLIEPVEILPDGTIISGHQRVRAAKLLGWKKIRCWIRHDLAEQGDDAAERRLIEANFNRRHLGLLDKARCYQRLLELERRKPRGDRERCGDLRDYVAQQFGCSGRNLERWVKVLGMPDEIQRAVTEKNRKLNLDLKMAETIAGLPRKTQDEIAEAIGNGAEPKKAVAEHLAAKSSAPAPDTAYRRLYQCLEQAVPVLGPGIEDLYRCCSQHLPLLRRSRKLLDTLMARIEKLAKRTSPGLEKKVTAMLAQNEARKGVNAGTRH